MCLTQVCLRALHKFVRDSNLNIRLSSLLILRLLAEVGGHVLASVWHGIERMFLADLAGGEGLLLDERWCVN